MRPPALNPVVADVSHQRRFHTRTVTERCSQAHTITVDLLAFSSGMGFALPSNTR